LDFLFAKHDETSGQKIWSAIFLVFSLLSKDKELLENPNAIIFGVLTSRFSRTAKINSSILMHYNKKPIKKLQ
tara:strand:+ start:310 stop:528 length:219 start_codon:yes stop_codon:yes gene_type:complete